jgi:hypothetical protein
VDEATAKQMLDRLAERLSQTKFNRYDLGIPCTLMPVRKEDYFLNGWGMPYKADGSDTFGIYLNGGVITGDGERYAAALYTVGRNELADSIIDRMLERIGHGDANAGGFPISIIDRFPEGAEFWTWDGKPCGYEGLLSHMWYFTQAVVIREPALRERLHRPLQAK